jgi:hypothetical protein
MLSANLFLSQTSRSKRLNMNSINVSKHFGYVDPKYSPVNIMNSFLAKPIKCHSCLQWIATEIFPGHYATCKVERNKKRPSPGHTEQTDIPEPKKLATPEIKKLLEIREIPLRGKMEVEFDVNESGTKEQQLETLLSQLAISMMQGDTSLTERVMVSIRSWGSMMEIMRSSQWGITGDDVQEAITLKYFE